MKFNVQNFLRSNETKFNKMWYIKDDELLVRCANGVSDFTGQIYHTVKWWGFIKRGTDLDLLMYIENPKLKYSIDEWSRRRNYFCKIYEILEKENANDKR